MTGRNTDSSVMYDIKTPAERAYSTDNSSNEYGNTNSGEVCKILYFGNSYIFANDFGAQLAVTANLQHKKFVIVSATHQNIFQEDELAANCWDNQSGTIVLTSDGTYKKGTRKFSDILNQDWGNLGRGGSWDYIISFDQDKYDIVKDYIGDSKNFISLNSTQKSQFSYVNENSIMRNYGNIRESNFLMTNTEQLPTVLKQYFRAMIIYTKIFGIEGFPTSADSDSFIKFYNEEDKELIDNDMYKIIKVEYRTTHCTKESRSITEDKARKIQYLVYNNYESYIK